MYIPLNTPHKQTSQTPPPPPPFLHHTLKQSDDDAKLRTYLPILKLYCEQEDVDAAFTLFHRMRDEPKVRLEPENYVLLLSTLAEGGYFRYVMYCMCVI